VIPPQAFTAIGVNLAKLVSMGAAQLATRALDRDIAKLVKLDEPALLVEIAHRDGTARIPFAGPDEELRSGRATVDRMLPWIRGRVCPHRDTLVKVTQSDEAKLVTAVVVLVGHGPGVALVAAVSTYLVKRGIPLLCDPQVAGSGA
jgi:hypothetical protein